MKRWAVSFINWYDHDLSTVLVEAPTWQEALFMHPEVTKDAYEPQDLIDIEAAKIHSFDMDSMIEVIEVV